MGTLTISPLQGGLGAEIIGLDLMWHPGEIDADLLLRTIDEHGILVVRNQALDHGALVDFSASFGPVMVHQVAEYLSTERPEVMTLSNNVDDGKPVGAPNNGIFWHSDQIFRRKPVSYTLLYGHEVPAAGGDTLFADMRAVYDDLPDDIRIPLEGRRAVHSFCVSYEKNYIEAAPLTPERRAANPDTDHPVFRTHQRTGRKAVFVDPDSTSHILGLDPVSSTRFLAALFAYLERPAYIYRHHWRRGDLVMWDNASLMHKATGYDSTMHRRVMWRTQVAGSEPV
jgi:taurine dioxygenase